MKLLSVRQIIATIFIIVVLQSTGGPWDGLAHPHAPAHWWTYAVLDRFVDETYAVLLIGPAEEEHVLHRFRLPAQAQEGDWLRFLDGQMRIDILKTKRAQARAAQKHLQLKAFKADTQRFRRLLSAAPLS